MLGPAPCVAVAACLALSACGGSGASSSGSRSRSSSQTTLVSHTTAVRPRRPRRPPAPSFPRLLPGATATAPSNFVPAVTWRGHTAVWVARRPAFALLSFDQRLVELRLHSGTIDAGSSGWRYGPSLGTAEMRHLVAAFNGGFKLNVGVGGFESYGRVGAPILAGFASVVTYSDGTTDIGTWRAGVPAPGKRVVSIRQNLHLLIDGGRPAADLGCLLCWGATLGGVIDPARSALGITADGRLIWAGGEHLTAQDLANILLRARVRRAIELDINPEWVAAYLYGHRGGHGPLAPVPIGPGQPGVPGQFLAPYSRDFFTIVAR